jgi:hypothetical protein
MMGRSALARRAYDHDMTETSPEPRPARSPGTPAVGLGAALVLIGLVLLAGQVFDIGIAEIGWPLIVIAIGVALLLIGLIAVGESGMVIGGTVVTTVGLVLLFQNETGLWATWAYAWALVGPAASGLGMVIWGLRTADGSQVRNGTWGLLGGLAMFAVGFLFFEGVIGLSGDRFAIAEWVLPAAVIGIGVVVLARGILQRRPEST